MKKSRLWVLDDIVKEMPGPVHVLEVGSYEGGSALRWSWAISQYKGSGSITCVDPWKPYEKAVERMNEDLGKGEAFRRFKENIKLANPSTPIDYFVGDIEEFDKQRVGFFDVVFIDGDHRYEQVRKDLQIGAQRLRSGGVLCGDDFNDYFPGVKRAVYEFFGPSVCSRSEVFVMRKNQTGWGALW